MLANTRVVSATIAVLAAAVPLAIGGCAASSTSSGRADGGRDARADGVDAGTADAASRCGDLLCTEGVEDCESCPLDCDVCPTCDMAPTCTGALAVPIETTALASFDNTDSGGDRTNYVCGADLGVAPGETTCADPQLRIRVREVAIERGFFDIERQLFCVISAEDGAHSELLLTSPRPVAGNRDVTSLNFRLSEGLLWGQGDLYRSISNVTITYQCYLSSDTAAAQAVLDDIAGRAADVAEHADGYGWVFGTVAVLGTIVGSSLSAIADDQIMDVQQTIAAGALLEMTNGRTWTIRERRGDLALSGASDLRITMESWGCAEPRTTFD